MIRFISVLFVSFLFAFPSYAASAATSSDAGYAVYGTEDEEALEDFLNDYGLENYIRDLYSGPGITETPENIYIASAPDYLETYDFTEDTAHKNVVVFTGTFDNYECELIIPYDSYSSLDIIDGKLVNVGPSAVQGRILYDGEVLDPSEYETYVYNLNPVWGNTQNVYQYGSFNYQRHYYVNRSGAYDRIVSDDTYGDFYPESTEIYFGFSDRSFYVLCFISVLLIGGKLLCRKQN